MNEIAASNVWVFNGWGNTNITLDWDVPEDLARQIPTRSQIHLFKHVEDQPLLDEA